MSGVSTDPFTDFAPGVREPRIPTSQPTASGIGSEGEEAARLAAEMDARKAVSAATFDAVVTNAVRREEDKTVPVIEHQKILEGLTPSLELQELLETVNFGLSTGAVKPAADLDSEPEIPAEVARAALRHKEWIDGSKGAQPKVYKDPDSSTQWVVNHPDGVTLRYDITNPRIKEEFESKYLPKYADQKAYELVYGISEAHAKAKFNVEKERQAAISRELAIRAEKQARQKSIEKEIGPQLLRLSEGEIAGAGLPQETIQKLEEHKAISRELVRERASDLSTSTKETLKDFLYNSSYNNPFNRYNLRLEATKLVVDDQVDNDFLNWLFKKDGMADILLSWDEIVVAGAGSATPLGAKTSADIFNLSQLVLLGGALTGGGVMALRRLKDYSYKKKLMLPEDFDNMIVRAMRENKLMDSDAEAARLWQSLIEADDELYEVPEMMKHINALDEAYKAGKVTLKQFQDAAAAVSRRKSIAITEGRIVDQVGEMMQKTIDEKLRAAIVQVKGEGGVLSKLEESMVSSRQSVLFSPAGSWRGAVVPDAASRLDPPPATTKTGKIKQKIEGFFKSESAPKTLQEIYADAYNTLGFYARTPKDLKAEGKDLKDVVGFFSPLRGEVQMRDFNDKRASVAFHELTHGLAAKIWGGVTKDSDEFTRTIPHTVKQDLIRFHLDMYGGNSNYSPSQYLEEGFVESVARFISDTDANISSGTAQFIVDTISERAPYLLKTRNHMRAYWQELATDPQKFADRIMDNRVTEMEKTLVDVLKETGEKAAKGATKALKNLPRDMADGLAKFFDPARDLRKLDEQMGIGDYKPEHATLYGQARRTWGTGRMASASLLEKGEMYAPNGEKITAPTVNDLSESLGGISFNKFANYMAANRALALLDRGIRTPFTEHEARVILRGYTEDEIATLEGAKDVWKEMHLAPLRMLVDHGAITKKLYNKMVKKEDFYISFTRRLDRAALEVGGAREAERMTDVLTGKEIKGGGIAHELVGYAGGKVRNPLESLVARNAALYNRARDAMIVKNLAGAALHAGNLSKWIVPVETKVGGKIDQALLALKADYKSAYGDHLPEGIADSLKYQLAFMTDKRPTYRVAIENKNVEFYLPRGVEDLLETMPARSREWALASYMFTAAGLAKKDRPLMAWSARKIDEMAMGLSRMIKIASTGLSAGFAMAQLSMDFVSAVAMAEPKVIERTQGVFRRAAQMVGSQNKLAGDILEFYADAGEIAKSMVGADSVMLRKNFREAYISGTPKDYPQGSRAQYISMLHEELKKTGAVHGQAAYHPKSESDIRKLQRVIDSNGTVRAGALRIVDGIHPVKKHVDAVSHVLSATEIGHRMAAAVPVAKAMGWRPGMEFTPEMTHAITMAYREGYVPDFKYTPEAWRYGDVLVPFLGAAGASTGRFARAVKKNPARAGLAIANVIAIKLAESEYFEGNYFYENQSPYQRYGYVLMPNPVSEVPIRLKLPPDVMGFAYPVAGAIERMQSRDPVKRAELSKAIRGAVWHGVTGAMPDLGIGRGYWGMATNEDSLTGHTIESPFDIATRKPKEQRRNVHVSRTTQSIYDLLAMANVPQAADVSPAQLQFLFNTYGSSLYNDIQSSADLLLGKDYGGFQDLPVLKKFAAQGAFPKGLSYLSLAHSELEGRIGKNIISGLKHSPRYKEASPSARTKLEGDFSAAVRESYNQLLKIDAKLTTAKYEDMPDEDEVNDLEMARDALLSSIEKAAGKGVMEDININRSMAAIIRKARTELGDSTLGFIHVGEDALGRPIKRYVGPREAEIYARKRVDSYTRPYYKAMWTRFGSGSDRD